MIEIWKDIKDFEGLYQVSNLGRIKSLKFRKERILKPQKHKNGYLYINLYKGNKIKHYSIHRLVAEAFVYNPDPINNIEVDHLNTNPSDNRAENLEWVDHIKNRHNPLTEQHHIDCQKGEKSCWYGKYGKEHHSSKPVLQFDLDGNFIKEWECTRQIERELGISRGNISSCCLGNYKTAYSFIWRYA